MRCSLSVIGKCERKIQRLPFFTANRYVEDLLTILLVPGHYCILSRRQACDLVSTIYTTDCKEGMAKHTYVCLFPRMLIVLYRDELFRPNKALFNGWNIWRLRLIPFGIVLRCCMEIPVGTRLGRYEVLSKLGAGAMGDVYLAHDSNLSRTVALKVLPNELASDEGRMLRFSQEARAISALNHPNIITIHEVNHVDKTHFIAVEFVKGMTLRERLARKSLLTKDIVEIAEQVAHALKAAHEAGIVHRDLKPENIMSHRSRTNERA